MTRCLRRRDEGSKDRRRARDLGWRRWRTDFAAWLHPGLATPKRSELKRLQSDALHAVNSGISKGGSGGKLPRDFKVCTSFERKLAIVDATLPASPSSNASIASVVL
jgi:hypothetical protein